MTSRNPPVTPPPRWATRLAGAPLVVYATDQRAAARIFCAHFGTAVTEAAVEAVYALPSLPDRLEVEDRRVTS